MKRRDNYKRYLKKKCTWAGEPGLENGMPCPACGERALRTIDSRMNIPEHYRKRRYVCLKCDQRFTTYDEFPVLDSTIPAGVAQFFGVKEAMA